MTERQLVMLVTMRRCLFSHLHVLHKFLATDFTKEPKLLIDREEEATSALQLTAAQYRAALAPAIPLLTKLTREEPIFSCLGTAAPTAYELLAKRAQKTIPKLVLALKRLRNEVPEDERRPDDAKSIVAEVPHSERAWALLEAKLEKETHWLAESISMSATLERIPRHVAWIFTTTNDGQDALFEASDSRCNRFSCPVECANSWKSVA
jgi:hypothetical protein